MLVIIKREIDGHKLKMKKQLNQQEKEKIERPLDLMNRQELKLIGLKNLIQEKVMKIMMIL
jgi:hypothetical protein